MTTGADTLLAWFHQLLAKIRTITDKTTDAPRRQYRIHVRRTCYRCQQEGHYARDCPRTTTPKPTRTRMEKMQSLLRSMTPNERAQFKREITPQMTAMQAHLKTMTTSELREFKRQITPDATQILVTALKNMKTPNNSLSRETSPHTNQTITEPSPSRETGPHPTKSTKKLAQALKKRAKHEIEQRTRAFPPNRLLEILAEALKSTVKTSRSKQSMKTLTNALKQHSEQESERPIRTYAERIRELIGPPEQCEKCGGEHSTHFCMKQFERL